MKEQKKRFNQYVREWLEDYRKRKSYSMEKMSEKLLEDTRSYYDQKKGKIGFSGWTICRLLFCLTNSEIQEFVGGLRTFVWEDEFKEE